MQYNCYRTVLSIGGGRARAFTRSGLDRSDRLAGLVTEAAALPVRSALIDGEAVVLDTPGAFRRPGPQGALKGAPETIDYFAFDLLELDGEDLTSLPLTKRKARLAAILSDRPRNTRYSEHITGHGEKLLKQFCAANLECVISKLASSPYVGGALGRLGG